VTSSTKVTQKVVQQIFISQQNLQKYLKFGVQVVTVWNYITYGEKFKINRCNISVLYIFGVRKQMWVNFLNEPLFMGSYQVLPKFIY
jgi:hypothetical protein